MQDFHNLRVTKRARELVVTTYGVTALLPRDERFGLVAQMRRAAISVGSNIAEGAGRGSDRELRAFLQIALGSSAELEFQLLAAQDLSFVGPDDAAALQGAIDHVRRMLISFISQLEGRDKRSQHGRWKKARGPAPE